MLKNPSYKQFVPKLSILFCLGWLVFMMFQNEVPVDVGDGLMHYFYSQASWENHDLFLHHWGKPFFILLSSPFAQLGFNGMVLFNILLFCGTALLGIKILQKFNISVWIQVLFPLILIHAHDYSETILGGLTEPLFNFATILSLFLLIEKKYIWFAVVVSLMPFMRSEGQLPVLLALVLLLYNKSYRSIPFLFSGFLVYALAGILVYSDFWWYFTESPYSMQNDIYGKGTWEHYFISYKNYLGNPGLYILMLGIPSMVFLLLKKKWAELQLEWSFYAYGIFLGVVLSHSYFWATGQNGSLGLTRIATQGMPLFLLLNLYHIGCLDIFKHKLAHIAFKVFALIIAIVLVTSKHFPVVAKPLDRQVIEAANYLEDFKQKEYRVYYHFPLFGYAYGENPFLKNQQSVFHGFGDLGEELKTILRPGDIIVRDSHFGPMEANLPLSEIQKYPQLVKIKEFISSEQIDDRFGEIEGVFIYQYIPLHKQKSIERIVKKLDKNIHLKIDEKQEYIDILSHFPEFSGDTKVAFEIRSSVDDIKLVFDYNNAQDYSSMDLKAGEEQTSMYLFRKSGETKLYIWNLNKKSVNVVISKIETEEVKYHPMME